MKKTLGILIALAIVVSLGFFTVHFYSYLFAKTVNGRILKVDRVTQAQALIASGKEVPDSQLFSFAVSIRDNKGEIHTASSEDRQWAVAQEGQCVEAKFFPYAPWELDQAGTYHNARLLRLYDCAASAP